MLDSLCDDFGGQLPVSSICLVFCMNIISCFAPADNSTKKYSNCLDATVLAKKKTDSTHANRVLARTDAVFKKRPRQNTGQKPGQGGHEENHENFPTKSTWIPMNAQPTN